MSSTAFYDSLSTSNSSLTSSSGTSPKSEGKFRRFARLAKIASLGSLFSTNSGSNSSGISRRENDGRRMGKSPSNSTISTSTGYCSDGKHRHRSTFGNSTITPPSLQQSNHQAQLSHHHSILPFAMSLPVISPLINVNNRQYYVDGSNDNQQQSRMASIIIIDEKKKNEETCANGGTTTTTTESQLYNSNKHQTDRSKFGSLRWLRGASFRRNQKATSKQPIELPPTILYPHVSHTPSRDEITLCPSIDMNGYRHSSINGQPTLKQTLSNLEMMNKRCSLYSQLSFDSIDSHLSVIDDSTLDEDYASSNRLAQSVTKSRPPMAPVRISLHDNDQTNNTTTLMYGKNSEKAKSDSHLYFCLDETSPKDGLKDLNQKVESPAKNEENSCHKDKCDQDENLKEKSNTNRRTSLYERIISVRRNANKSSSSNTTTNSIKSVKQRFKFRSSNKVPRLFQSNNKTNNNSSECESKVRRKLPPLPTLYQSNHRASEPSINDLHQTKLSMMSIGSASSANLYEQRRKKSLPIQLPSPMQPPPPPPPLPPTRRSSYKNATTYNVYHGSTQSSILLASPLTITNSVNSTPYCLDHYTRSSLNTIKSDDNALSSEGYGTDRGITPDVTSVDLPPYSPDSTGSHGSHSRESRSLIRTIRKRLSFNKRSKSVERQPNTYRDRTTTDNGDDERARSVPGSREPSAPREMINGKKQESYLSLASNASYFAENSTLVLECIVDGEKRHYIVPVTKGNKRKIRRRKGTKLHVFNDHLFVAQHVASRIECQVCHKSFPLRIGKQGYQCRECGILTHKQCHANVESYCPANGASRLNFDLENSNSFVQSTTPLPQVRVIAPSEGSPINE
ncbi:C2cd2p [Blomia tropicalis]|nr:C2cd2p [Blomia tropicalis]